MVWVTAAAGLCAPGPAIKSCQCHTAPTVTMMLPTLLELGFDLSFHLPWYLLGTVELLPCCTLG